MYSALTLIVISVLLGMFLGCGIFVAFMNWAIRDGMLDLYFKGKRVKRVKVF